MTENCSFQCISHLGSQWELCERIRSLGEGWEHCQDVGITLVAWWRTFQKTVWGKSKLIFEHQMTTMVEAWNSVKLCLKLTYAKCFLSKGLHTELRSIHSEALKCFVAHVSIAPCLIQPPLRASWKCLGLAVCNLLKEKRTDLCICFLGCLNEIFEVLILKGICFVTGWIKHSVEGSWWGERCDSSKHPTSDNALS